MREGGGRARHAKIVDIFKDMQILWMFMLSRIPIYSGLSLVPAAPTHRLLLFANSAGAQNVGGEGVRCGLGVEVSQ